MSEHTELLVTRRPALLRDADDFPCPFCGARMQYAESSRYVEWTCTNAPCHGHCSIPVLWQRANQAWTEALTAERDAAICEREDTESRLLDATTERDTLRTALLAIAERRVPLSLSDDEMRMLESALRGGTEGARDGDTR